MTEENIIYSKHQPLMRKKNYVPSFHMDMKTVTLMFHHCESVERCMNM